MADYIYVPIIDELITLVEHDSEYDNNVKAMLSTTLSHCFPIALGFALAPKHENGIFSHFILYRLRRHVPGDRRVIKHAFIQAKRRADTLDESLGQLLNALETANTENKRCWAILAIGTEISFYEYHQELPKNERLLPWCPPGQSINRFNIRHD